MKILDGNKFGIAMIVAAAGLSAINANRISNENAQIKNEIKVKDPERYDKLQKYNDASWQNIVDWKYERQKMNDSLKMDSAVQKAYFKGAQMVRDSIKKAERN